MKIRAIITGATGMVGEGVLHECLHHDAIEEVLVINRQPCGVEHPRLREIIHKDFFDLSALAGKLSGYNACFFCLGVSSVGMKEEEFYRLTYVLTMGFAKQVAAENSDLVFCYISGAGTNEKGRLMWARVKGKTETDLAKLPFKKAYAFRPGYMHPTKGLRNTLKAYKYISWLYPLLRFLFPGRVSTLKELGLAMIQVTVSGYPKNIIEVKDILALSRSTGADLR